MKIEKMSYDDLPEVLVLANQLGYPSNIEEVRSRFRKISESSGYALFIARSEGGKVVGYVQINIEPGTLLAGLRADVAALIVDTDERGKGIGKALLAQAEQWANGNHLLMVRIRSNIVRKHAHRFYQREGYALSKTSHVFTKEMD